MFCISGGGFTSRLQQVEACAQDNGSGAVVCFNWKAPAAAIICMLSFISPSTFPTYYSLLRPLLHVCLFLVYLLPNTCPELGTLSSRFTTSVCIPVLYSSTSLNPANKDGLVQGAQRPIIRLRHSCGRCVLRKRTLPATTYTITAAMIAPTTNTLLIL